MEKYLLDILSRESEEEAGILGHDGGVIFIQILQLGGLEGDPQVALHALGKGVVAGGGATADLPIYELVGGVHAANHVGQNGGQLLLGVGDVDLQSGGTAEHTVDVLLQSEDLVVVGGAGLVDAVTKEMYAVVERDGHFVKKTEFPVIIA